MSWRLKETPSVHVNFFIPAVFLWRRGNVAAHIYNAAVLFLFCPHIDSGWMFCFSFHSG